VVDVVVGVILLDQAARLADVWTHRRGGRREPRPYTEEQLAFLRDFLRHGRELSERDLKRIHEQSLGFE